MEQNLPFAFAGGAVAAVVGGVIWALVTVSSGYQIGWMAVGVGFLVGYSVRFLGKGIDKVFGVIGASLALFGCLLGNFFSIIGFAAKQESMGIFAILTSLDYSLVPDVMIEAFSPMDLLFYGIAIYEGYRFSFRQVTEEEVMENME
ncbi:MAG: hypothetical protein JSS79_10030 [Bacteroidetes bacterium]|nr:hypothetical protein [Bacteroidota bacterium]